MSLTFDACPTNAPSGHGMWSEADIDWGWRAVLSVWPGDDARAARAVSSAIAAGLTPDCFRVRLAAGGNVAG